MNTIADYEQVIVMDRGRIIEKGAPHSLIAKGGVFAEMVEHTGKNAAVIKSIAERAYKNISLDNLLTPEA